MTETITTETTTLTLDQVRETTRAVVEEFGADTTYAARHLTLTGVEQGERETCRYYLQGEPACLAGVVLDRLGIVVPEGLEGSGVMSVFYSNLMEDVTVEDGAETYLLYAQGAQDNKKTWGEALEAAEQRVAHLLEVVA